MDIKQYMAEQRPQIESMLDQLLPQPVGSEAELYQAMRHSVLSGGKRLRPLLFLLTADLFALDKGALLPFAAGLEMLHTYSLVHDDLPAMDDDDLRRGVPTCHKIYGEATAILVGDALLTEAFAAMLSIAAPPERLIAATRRLAMAAGPLGMVAGQFADLASENEVADLQRLVYIYRRKTGELFTAAIAAAAILAGAEAEELAALEEYGYQIGLAFQITDDILDIIGESVELGKPIGSDAAQGKNTYATGQGLEQAQADALAAVQAAASAIASFGARAELLTQLALELSERRF